MQNASSSSPSTAGLHTPKALSTVSSSQQSSAETFRDLPKISITVPTERMAKPKILSPVSPGSRVAEETNERFMQNNCKQDEKYSHNAGTSSSQYYLNPQNTSRRVRMLSENTFDKLKRLCSGREDSMLIIPDVPEIDHLMIVHREKYKQRLLDKIFNYGRIVNHPQKGSYRFRNRTLYYTLDQTLQLNGNRLSNEDLVTIKSFERGVGLLKYGYEKEGKKEIIKSADKELTHAMYVYAIITFKEIVKCLTDSESQLPKKKDIKKAVQYMLLIEKDFFPLPSFILGIMILYDRISIIQKFAEQVTSARKCFDYVLNRIRYSEGNYSLNLPMKYIIIEDEREYKECLEWIVQSIKYELATDMLLCLEDLFDTKSLLKELSSEGFIDAKYLYALALLKNTFSDQQIFKKFNFDRAYTLLEQASYHGHKEAMFCFGSLPFRQDFKLLDKESQSLKGSFCFGYLGKYIEACGKDGEFKKDAAILIAAEYVKDKSFYVTYDEEMAKYILEENDCSYELEKLKEKLQEREDRATNKLPDVLSALEKVHSELKKDIEPSAQKLLSKVKELLDALQVSGLIVQQSPLLSPTLELLHMPSTMEQGFLISLLPQLYDILEPQVVSQSHYSSRKGILPLLHSLFSTCVALQIERSRGIFSIPEDFNPNEASTSLQMERSCNISLTPSENRQDSSPICSTKNITRGSSVSDFESDYSAVNIHTPKIELISPLARNNSELKELENSKNGSDSNEHSTYCDGE